MTNVGKCCGDLNNVFRLLVLTILEPRMLVSVAANITMVEVNLSLIPHDAVYWSPTLLTIKRVNFIFFQLACLNSTYDYYL